MQSSENSPPQLRNLGAFAAPRSDQPDDVVDGLGVSRTSQAHRLGGARALRPARTSSLGFRRSPGEARPYCFRVPEPVARRSLVLRRAGGSHSDWPPCLVKAGKKRD